MSGNDIQASEGMLGNVDDFLIDVETCVIRYLVIDTQNWWSGKMVLLSPKWIDAFTAIVV